MNTLSWLIYLAGVADNIGMFCFIVVFCCCIVLFGCLISIQVSDGDVLKSQSWRKLVKRVVFAAVAAFLVGSFIPSRDSVYAIAASEMGEELLKTETVSKATEALHTWLDRQIAPSALQPAT